jgi:hypothetical protein
MSTIDVKLTRAKGIKDVEIVGEAHLETWLFLFGCVAVPLVKSMAAHLQICTFRRQAEPVCRGDRGQQVLQEPDLIW